MTGFPGALSPVCRCLFWVTLAVRCTSLAVSGHPLLQNTWWVTVESNRLEMRVSSTLREVCLVCGPAFAEHLPTVPTGWQDALQQQGAYLRRHLQAEVDGRPGELELQDWSLVADSSSTEPPESPLYLDRTYAVFDFVQPLIGTASPSQLRFSSTSLQEQRYAPGISWEVVYSIAVKNDDRRTLGAGIVRSEMPFVLELPLPIEGRSPPTSPPDSSRSSTSYLGSYVHLGVHHILTGYDHLLFLAALALAAVRLSDYLRLIVVFTCAHSLTVTAVALNWIHAPPRLVEPFIAATIVWVGVENGLLPRIARSVGRLVTAFGFGLVHGLGFASGLQGSLTRATDFPLVWAIVGFCAGVELGHLLVGIPFWSCIRWSYRSWGLSFQKRFECSGAVGITLGGLYFLFAALRQYVWN